MEPNAPITDWTQFPAQRNFEDKYGRYFNCEAGYEQVSHVSHFRVYLPCWANERFGLDEDRRMVLEEYRRGALSWSAQVKGLRAHWVLIGEGSEDSNRGDYRGDAIPPDCRYDAIPPVRESSVVSLFSVGDQWANEANGQEILCDIPGEPNRFAHRHYGGGNYLFGDFHAERSTTMREELACDFDLNGAYDPLTGTAREASGCSRPLPP